jgi:CheY-like chemotaxis protein
MYRFLIVDDNHDEALQLSYLITSDFSKEAECEFASNRTDALEWLDARKHKPFHATLLDLNLPESRGVETYRAVRAAAPEMPILIWTGRNDERGLRDLLIDEGAAGYLEKGKVSHRQIFQDLRDAARRAQTCVRMPLEDKQLLVETERRGQAYVEEVRSSNPPKSEQAQAAAINALIKLHVSQTKHSAQTSARLEKTLEDVAAVRGHVSRLEDRLADAEETGRHTALNLSTVQTTTERNKWLLKRIALALAIIAYTLNEGGDLLDKILPLLGLSP